MESWLGPWPRVVPGTALYADGSRSGPTDRAPPLRKTAAGLPGNRTWHAPLGDLPAL